eukprot:TRINITY_DN5517_c0_g1_i2.p1 TRINITY_DN5517_c0_g1~~TRINITY_DN5517_c0_g1_i2.p1  ORF type:complete len:660 (+),score=142.74 TRINITY_DN5517_c0_g1_i2:22-2001(+)
MSLFTFGRGENGEIGNGTSVDSLDPVLIDLIPGVVTQVAGGEKHGLAVNDVGELYAWGRGREGQLGVIDRKFIEEFPVLVDDLREDRIVDIACGAYHSLAVTKTGDVYQWGKLHKFLDVPQYYGSGSVKMVGMNEDDDMPAWKKRLKQILDESNRQYYSEGRETDYGDGNTHAFSEYSQRTPMFVTGLEGIKIVKVYAGFSFSFAVSEDKRVFSWGFNGKMQLGIGSRFNLETPEQVVAFEGFNIVKIACGEQHVLAIDDQGAIYSWGLGTFGQLGHGNIQDKGYPTRIKALEEHNIIDIACGVHHSVAIDDAGNIFTWGNNEYGQQGAFNEFEDWGTVLKDYYHSIPRQITTAYKLKRVVCGSHYNMGITTDNEIVTWGWGITGALGHGDRRFQVTPTIVERLKGEKPQDINAANCTSFVIMENKYSTFSNSFKSLINTGENSDLTLLVSGKEVKVHKVIVFNRCPYLKDYAEVHKILSGEENVLPLPYDFYPFRSLIRYLYTDKLKAVAHHIPVIIELAELMEIPRLVILAQKYRMRYYNEEGIENIIVPDSEYGTDMSKAINSQEYSDIAFTLSDNSVIYGHKAILKNRSDYFKIIFESQFRESNQTEIDIKEMDKETFILLLNYIYANRVELNMEKVVEVLLASDRFLLTRMKQV